MCNEKKIQSLMTSLKGLIEDKDLIGTKNSKKLKKRVRQIDRIFKINLAVIITTCFLNYVLTFVVHRLPLKMWAPWTHDDDNGIIFWLTASYQLVDLSIAAPAMLIMDTLPIFFMTYATGLIEELTCCLENVSIEPQKKIEKKRSGNEPGPSHGKTIIKVQPIVPREDEPLKALQKLIPIHVKIKTFVLDIQDLFGTIFFLQEFMSISILCTTAFALTLVSF
jgi:hypothetical protein